MEYTFEIDGTEKSLEVEQEEDAFVVTIEGRRYRVNGKKLPDGSIAFFVDSVPNLAFLSKNETGTTLTLKGRKYHVRSPVDEALPGSSHTGMHGDGSIESPMPGSIVALNVEEGDEVKQGEAVVVIESMKMQNEITAPLSGRVRKVNCKVGDQVSFGELLLEIEPLDRKT